MQMRPVRDLSWHPFYPTIITSSVRFIFTFFTFFSLSLSLSLGLCQGYGQPYTSLSLTLKQYLQWDGTIRKWDAQYPPISSEDESLPTDSSPLTETELFDEDAYDYAGSHSNDEDEGDDEDFMYLAES